MSCIGAEHLHAVKLDHLVASASAGFSSDNLSDDCSCIDLQPFGGLEPSISLLDLEDIFRVCSLNSLPRNEAHYLIVKPFHAQLDTTVTTSV